MSVTIFLASYAAIVSTIDILWKLRNSRADRGKLEVCGLLAAITRNSIGESFPHQYRLDMRELGESQSTDIYIHDLDPLRDGAIGIAVQDSHGKLWHLPDAEFRALQEVMLRFRL